MHFTDQRQAAHDVITVASAVSQHQITARELRRELNDQCTKHTDLFLRIAMYFEMRPLRTAAAYTAGPQPQTVSEFRARFEPPTSHHLSADTQTQSAPASM